MSDTSSTEGGGFAGQQGLWPETSDFNKLWFLIKQLLGLINGSTLVKVISCTNAGGVSPVGTVDVQPLVNLIDGLGNSSPHGIVHGLPYARVQGGANAVILDPQPNDIGVAVFADRDISSVKANRGQANPGSRRRFDMADGVYLFSVITVRPNQFVQFTSTGITLTDINGNIIVMGPGSIAMTTPKLTVSGDIVAGFGGADWVSLLQHIHDGVMPGGGDTTPPIPGT